MRDAIRNTLVDPLKRGTLKAIVPDLVINNSDRQAVVPAELVVEDGSFLFSVFSDDLWNERLCGLAGHVDGNVWFDCTGEFLLRSIQTTFAGKRVSRYRVREIELPDLTEAPPPKNGFLGHAVFHGPKLVLPNAGTRTTARHEFLGDLVSEHFDTHRFGGDGWNGALIQRDDELHLHVQSDEEAEFLSRDPEILFRAMVEMTGFTHGFEPLPIYERFVVDGSEGRAVVKPDISLRQARTVPLPRRHWSGCRHAGDDDAMNILATLAEGFERLSQKQRERLHFLLWNMRASETAELPNSTEALIVCSALDGLMRIAGNTEEERSTKAVWEAAARKLGLAWDTGWFHEVYRLRPKHRNALAHGRLWHIEESGDFAALTEDIPRLRRAFNAIFCLLCGYRGPVADGYAEDGCPRVRRLSDLIAAGGGDASKEGVRS